MDSIERQEVNDTERSGRFDFEFEIELLRGVVKDLPTADIHGKGVENEFFGAKCDICDCYAYMDSFGRPLKSAYCQYINEDIYARKERR